MHNYYVILFICVLLLFVYNCLLFFLTSTSTECLFLSLNPPNLFVHRILLFIVWIPGWGFVYSLLFFWFLCFIMRNFNYPNMSIPVSSLWISIHKVLLFGSFVYLIVLFIWDLFFHSLVVVPRATIKTHKDFSIPYLSLLFEAIVIWLLLFVIQWVCYLKRSCRGWSEAGQMKGGQRKNVQMREYQLTAEVC